MIGWWPEFPVGEVRPLHYIGENLRAYQDELNIRRYQKYVERPALSKIDAKPYMAHRKWAIQFYDVPAGAASA